MVIQGTGKAKRMKAGKVYTVGIDTGNYLISKGFAVPVDSEEKKEEQGVLVRSTVPIKPVEQEQSKRQSDFDFLQSEIYLKTKQFKEAVNKDDKKRLRKEINELKAQINE